MKLALLMLLPSVPFLIDRRIINNNKMHFVRYQTTANNKYEENNQNKRAIQMPDDMFLL